MVHGTYNRLKPTVVPQRAETKGPRQDFQDQLGKKPELYICPVCRYPFTAQSRMLFCVHYKQCAKDDKPFTCLSCDREFNAFSHLRKHMKSKHKQQW
ncbi:hypothetical protein L596_022446 [Steinernema carpocapsae]|uniref:C2H2-type domain-containing protein n=1 Tax=Steinernema carpocapsae TaxID=34508 RepID=A0A4U5MLT6_STECR|nr:hypothetical protein L596_022446 [Steinernema carpocapsae]